MTDLLLTPDGDLELLANDLALDAGLWSAVVVSVLSDRRVAPEDSPDGTLRGWWGEDAGDPLGSRLWTLAREKQLELRLPEIEALVEESLAWLLEDEVAESVQVQASYPSRELVEITVRIRRGAAPRWADVWRGARNGRLERAPYSLAMVLEDSSA
ncbi:MAG: phage GP46 family protein [Planctomycetota bacterium]